MASKITTFDKSRLTLGAHSEFHTSVNNLIKANDAEALHIATQAARYNEAVATESSIVTRETTFVATPAMESADNHRDKILSTINAVVNAHQWNPITAKKTSYNYLAATIAPYKGIREHEYSRETAEVTSLLNALSTGEAAEHVATLGLTDEVAELSAANARFSIEFDKKMAEVAARSAQASIDTKEARATCDAIYGEMTELLNAYSLIQPTEALTAFIASLNGIIETYRLIAANTGKSTTKEEETTDSETN